MARLDALVLGKPEADAYERCGRDRRARRLRRATLESPFQSTMDELYWCLRRLQAYEAWQLHGAWITAKPRRLGPGIKERFEFGATRRPQRPLHAEEVRRIAFRAELAEMLGKDGFLVLPTVPGAAPLKSAPQQEMQAYRERALQAALPVRPVRLSADHAADRRRCMARRSASRCSGRPAATSR